MTMSRSGNTGRSLGICKSWLVSATSMPSVISLSLMIAIINLYLFNLALVPSPTNIFSLRVSVFHRNLEFHPPAVLNLGKTNCQHSICNFGSCIANAYRPTHRHQPAKFSVTTLRTMMRKYLVARYASFFLAPNSQLRVSRADLDLFG